MSSSVFTVNNVLTNYSVKVTNFTKYVWVFAWNVKL
jgi:hypothetical protein